MTEIHRLQAVFSDKNWINEVIAPPYDVVSRAQVKQATEKNPKNFLNVTRPEALLEDRIAFNDESVYLAAHEQWQRLLKEGVFQSDTAPRYYIYAMEDGERKQYGLVGLISVLDYKNGLIRKHELTRPDKENDRVRHIQAVKGQLSPVLLAVRDKGEIATLLKNCAAGEPLLSAHLNGVQHELWAVTAPENETSIKSLFAAQPLLYVADGHHRSAAALRAYEASPETAPPYCFAVVFPGQDMKIMGYHRTVQDLHGHSPESFIDALKTHYEIQLIADLSLPVTPGICHMMLGSQAFSLKRKDTHETDPILSLDVSALSRFVLEPILGIADIRTDPRIGFVGGLNAVAEVKQAVESGEAAVGFLMYPTQTEQLFAVADANLLMPPKSTWFEPKLADGLIAYSF